MIPRVTILGSSFLKGNRQLASLAPLVSAPMTPSDADMRVPATIAHEGKTFRWDDRLREILFAEDAGIPRADAMRWYVQFSSNRLVYLLEHVLIMPHMVHVDIREAVTDGITHIFGGRRWRQGEVPTPDQTTAFTNALTRYFTAIACGEISDADLDPA